MHSFVSVDHWFYLLLVVRASVVGHLSLSLSLRGPQAASGSVLNLSFDNDVLS